LLVAASPGLAGASAVRPWLITDPHRVVSAFLAGLVYRQDIAC